MNWPVFWSGLVTLVSLGLIHIAPGGKSRRGRRRTRSKPIQATVRKSWRRTTIKVRRPPRRRKAKPRGRPGRLTSRDGGGLGLDLFGEKGSR